MWSIAFMIGIFLLVGLISGYTLDGFMNVLWVVAIFMVIAKILQRKQPSCAKNDRGQI